MVDRRRERIEIQQQKERGGDGKSYMLPCGGKTKML
jgi:hypothetical protein